MAPACLAWHPSSSLSMRSARAVSASACPSAASATRCNDETMPGTSSSARQIAAPVSEAPVGISSQNPRACCEPAHAGRQRPAWSRKLGGEKYTQAMRPAPNAGVLIRGALLAFGTDLDTGDAIAVLDPIVSQCFPDPAMAGHSPWLPRSQASIKPGDTPMLQFETTGADPASTTPASRQTTEGSVRRSIWHSC